MSSRKFAALLITFIAIVALTAVALYLAPTALSGLPQNQENIALVAIAASLTLVTLLLYILIDRVIAPDPVKQFQEPLEVAVQFNQRVAGMPDEATLAVAIGEMLGEWLSVHRSGWLLLTPSNTHLEVRSLAGRGELPESTFTLERTHWLINALNQRRKPVLHEELKHAPMEAEAKAWFNQLGVSVYAPVVEAGLLIAILALGPNDERLPFRTRQLRLIELMATLAAPSLRAARLQTEARQLQDKVSSLQQSLAARPTPTAPTANQLSNAHNDFITIASHELRTPLTQLMGFTELLQTLTRDEMIDRTALTQTASNITRAGERLDEVIAQIMDISRLDSNAMEFRFQATTVEAILRGAVEPYLNAIRARRLNLRIHGLNANLPKLFADERRMAQAIGQLTSNAIKYTPDGGEIQIGLEMMPAQAEQSPRIHWIIMDSGVGIDPQYHQAIFEKFRTLGEAAKHSTSTTKFMGGGPGLGLAIARGIVERHGGRIWVESPAHDPAKLPGSRFHVLLPLKPPAFDPRTLNSETLPPEHRMTGPLKPFISE